VKKRSQIQPHQSQQPGLSHPVLTSKELLIAERRVRSTRHRYAIAGARPYASQERVSPLLQERKAMLCVLGLLTFHRGEWLYQKKERASKCCVFRIRRQPPHPPVHLGAPKNAGVLFADFCPPHPADGMAERANMGKVKPALQWISDSSSRHTFQLVE